MCLVEQTLVSDGSQVKKLGSLQSKRRTRHKTKKGAIMMQRINEESTYISNHPKQQWLNLTADRRCAVEQ